MACPMEAVMPCGSKTHMVCPLCLDLIHPHTTILDTSFYKLNAQLDTEVFKRGVKSVEGVVAVELIDKPHCR